MSKLSLILALLLAVMTVSCQSNDVSNDTESNESSTSDNAAVNESADDTDTEADETESAASEETLAMSADGTFTAEDLYFAPAGTDITLSPDDDFSQSVDALGSPVSFNEAPSCNYDGNDKVYEYDGYTVYTYPADETDKILIVELFGENCATPKGISVGTSVAEMEASYGTDYVQNGFLYEYSCDDGVLCFTVESDAISLIEFVSHN